MTKLLMLFVVMGLSACNTNPKLFMNISNNIDQLPKKDRVVYLEKNKATVDDVRMGDVVKSVLKDNGWKIVDTKSAAEVVATYKVEISHSQRNESRPVYGRSGINSINTYNYGAYSNSNVDYDYGVTGYQNYTYDVYRTCFKLSLSKLDKKTQQSDEPIYNSELCTDGNIEGSLMRGYVESIYSGYLENPDSKNVFECRNNGTQGIGNCFYTGHF